MNKTEQFDAKRLASGVNPDTRALWELIFDEDSAQFLDYYDAWRMKENACYGIYDGETLVSMLQLNPYEVIWEGSATKTDYIIAVATREEYRHKGLMTKLLAKSLGDLRKEKIPFVFLQPAAKEIYLPSGFRFFYETNTKVYYGHEEAAAFPHRRAVRDDIPLLMQFCEQQNTCDIYTKRDWHYFERLFAELESENGYLELLFEGEELKAIVSVWGFEEPEVREVIGSAKELAEAYIRSLPCDEIEAMGLPWETGAKRPLVMGRIVHVESFLSLYKGSKNEKLLLDLQDELIPDNSGIYEWMIYDGACSRARKFSKEEADNIKDADRKITMDAPSLFEYVTEGKTVWINEVV